MQYSDSYNFVKHAPEVVAKILGKAISCNSPELFERMWDDLVLFSPALAVRSHRIPGPLSHTMRERFKLLFDKEPPTALKYDGSQCSIDKGGPLLWSAIHLLACTPRLVEYAGAMVRPLYVFLLHLPQYFPVGCPCRANYMRELPEIQTLMRVAPQAPPAILIQKMILMHGRINVMLGKDPLPPGQTEASLVNEWCKFI